jgi:hypothetical protein
MEELIKWTNLQRVLGEFAVELRNRYQDNLIRDNKIASGNLLNSIDYKVQYDDRTIWVELHLEDYYKWVENGRAPGKFPPPDKIMEWIRIKPVIPDDRGGKLPTEQQLAFLIGRKIAEEGIEPGNQLHNAMDDIYPQFEERIDEAIALDINDAIEIIFSSFFN